MKTRLEDIASEAGVSVATVSRVVNGKEGVSDETRQAVLMAAELLGYDRPARPRRPRSGLVGIIVPELHNPVFPVFVQQIETALAAHGYTPMLCTTFPVVQENEYIDMLVDRGVAGLVFVAGRHANTEADLGRYHELRASGMPMVLINGYVDGLDTPFISTDDAGAMAGAVEHLHGLGHRRIGCVMGPLRYITSQRKVAGFLRGMASLEPDRGGWDDLVAQAVFSVEGGQAAMETLLDRGVTGAVCGSDIMALGAIRAVRARGLQVPADVSVVGYDDSPLIGFTDPPLTTMRQDAAAMCRQAVEILFDEISRTPQPRRELLFRTELVVRRSTAPPPPG